jgi:hypothetical protein
MVSMLLGNFVPCVLEKEERRKKNWRKVWIRSSFWAAAFGEVFLLNFMPPFINDWETIYSQN